MEPEGSSPYTQELATCPYPEPDQFLSYANFKRNWRFKDILYLDVMENT
jgi:hypothetical protein